MRLGFFRPSLCTSLEHLQGGEEETKEPTCGPWLLIDGTGHTSQKKVHNYSVIWLPSILTSSANPGNKGPLVSTDLTHKGCALAFPVLSHLSVCTLALKGVESRTPIPQSPCSQTSGENFGLENKTQACKTQRNEREFVLQ